MERRQEKEEGKKSRQTAQIMLKKWGKAKRSNYITKKEAKQLNCKQPKEENQQTD